MTIYATTTPTSVPINQPSHLWVNTGSLSMANTVIAPEPGVIFGPVRELVRVESAAPIRLNTNNHVSDGSLAGTATGDAGLESPFRIRTSFKPLVDSSLIDAGDNAHAVNPRTGNPLNNDILGKARIDGLRVDIGAVEVQRNHAVNDSYSTKQDTALTIAQPGVLACW